MRILLFGGTGQVGREIQARANAHGAVVDAPGRDRVDLLDTQAIIGAIARTGANLVINAAAHTAVDLAESEEAEAFALNARAPETMARACREHGLPLIHVSTDYVFGGDKLGAWVETDPTGPINVYGRSKLAGEQAIISAGGRYLIVRTSWVFSPHGRNFVKTMLGLVGRPELRVVDDQCGRPTAAGDLADFLLVAGARLLASEDPDLTGIVHFAGEGVVTWRGFAEVIFAMAAGARPKLVPVTTAEYPTPARRPANSELDCGKAEKVYGVRPRPWRKGLAETLSVLRDESGEGSA